MGQENQVLRRDFQGNKFPDLAVLYPEEFDTLYEHAELLEIGAAQPVIEEGQPGEYLYLVKYGLLRVIKKHDDIVYEVATINSGDIFGEASVLYQSVAGAEVRATDDCALYTVPAEVIRDLLRSNDRFLRGTTQLAEKRSAASALAVNPIFSTLPMAVREVALFNAKFASVEVGEEIVSEGDTDSPFMFIILSGELEVFLKHPSQTGKQIKLAELSSGDEAGEIRIVTNLPHDATVVAKTSARILALNNNLIMAWMQRHSDFAFALYGQVYKKLQNNRTLLEEQLGEEDAKLFSVSMLPPLERFKTKHGL